MMFKQKLLLLIFLSKSSLCDVRDVCSTNDANFTHYTTADITDCNCNPSSCIRKCCRHGFVYMSDDNFCKKPNETLGPVQYYYQDNTQINLESGDGFRIGMLDVRCKPRLWLTGEIHQNGSLYINGGILSPKEYCINREDDTLYYFYCPDKFKNESDELEMKQEFSCIGELISVPFLLATFLVYAFLPERNIQRNALMFHTLSLTSHNILFSLSQQYTPSDYNLCKISGFLRLYFRSAAYFWVNVMCFDVWIAFRGLNGVRGKVDKDIIRLIFVNIYAWGMPSLFILMVFLGRGISEKNCYLKVPEYLTFNVGSGMILLLFNVVLFTLTTRNIQRNKKEFAKVTGSNSTCSSEIVDRFTLYWNLIFVVGYSTLFNVHLIHLAIVSAASSDYSFTFLKYYSGFINGTYGIGIFIIYVCRKRIREAVKKRYFQLIEKFRETEISSTGNTVTSNPE